MRKILLFSLFLTLGLVLSQMMPTLLGSHYESFTAAPKVMLYICLAFIMINVGREFEVDKAHWRSYIGDFAIALSAAVLPWLLVSCYYVFALLPSVYHGSWEAWKENLMLGLFSAPTSAGILFAMLAAIGLSRSWVYKKIQVLAIFDDLATIVLMIPLQIIMVGAQWQMGAVMGIVVILLVFGWNRMNSFNVRQDWQTILGAASLLILATWALNYAFHIHLEVLLPAFVMGMVMKHRHIDTPGERRAESTISFLFMFLVGLGMPYFLGGGTTADDTSICGAQPMLSWGAIAVHVLIVSFLSNLGKMVPLFCYRDRTLRERLALSVGMFTRGEVGTGIIFIAIGYNIGGSVLIISVLTIVLNLLLTGIFVAWVKRLALKAYSHPAILELKEHLHTHHESLEEHNKHLHEQ